MKRASEAMMQFREGIRDVEAILVEMLASVAPWLAPVAPAYLVWEAMQARFGMPTWVALAIALAVETLGISAVSTAVVFWEYNLRRRKSDPVAPVGAAGVLALAYWVLVLIVVVGLDEGDVFTKVVKGGLGSLTVIAAGVLALRAQHAQAVQQARKLREEKRKARKLRAQMQKKAKVAVQNVEGLRERMNGGGTLRRNWRHLSEEERKAMRTLRVPEIMERYGVSERTAQNWRRWSLEMNNDGQGQEAVAVP